MIRRLVPTPLVLLALLGCVGTLQAAPSLAPPTTKPVEIRPDIHTGIESALEAAAKDNALVLIIFGSRGCPACQELQAKTLSSSSFRERGGPLHVVYVDVDGLWSKAAEFEVSAVPDLVLMTPDLKIISRQSGFLSPEALRDWIERGRLRLTRGTWEGVALDIEPDAWAERSGDEEYKALVQALGELGTPTGERAGSILRTRGAWGMPFLIDGLDDPFLAVRIGAAELLHQMAPEAPAMDPWDDPKVRTQQVAAVRTWWDKTGKLSDTNASSATLTPEETRAASEAIEGVLNQNAVQRTRAMTTLVRLGAGTLDLLRQTIHRCGENGNQEGLVLMEDIRWRILVPEDVEARACARRVLARGTSEERQAATKRLGEGGASAFSALRELIDDHDTLVRESAVHALKSIPGDESLAATAMLLQARDTNLRMVAAQALGNSKNRKAAPYLATAVEDPDEVVACAAIAGLDEIGAKDQQEVLIKCLKDKRWRVRAAAAETLGRLDLKGANPDLLELLEDEDPFVVKNALAALGQTKGVPGISKLRAVIKRTPQLTNMAIACVMKSDTPETLKVIEEIYDESPERRADVLDGLAETYSYNSRGDEHWKALLDKAIASEDAQIRFKLVSVLEDRSVARKLEYVGKLLDDPDTGVRVAAATLALDIAAYHWGTEYDSDNESDAGILDRLEKEERKKTGETPKPRTARGLGGIFRRLSGEASPEDKADPKTFLKRAQEIRLMHQTWHTALGRTMALKKDLAVILAFYVTGDGKTDLDVLGKIVQDEELVDQARKRDGPDLTVVVRRFPWPESRQVVGELCRSAVFYSKIAEDLEHASEDLKSFLTEPDRVVALVENVQIKEASQILQLLLNNDSDGISLYAPSKTNEETLGRLARSKVPLARATAVFVLGSRSSRSAAARPRYRMYGGGASPYVETSTEPETSSPELRLNAPEIVGNALQDENSWVRYAAVLGIMNLLSDQQEREQKLAPLLDDDNSLVVALAAFGILDENLRNNTSFYRYGHLRFEDMWVWTYYSRSTSGGPIGPPIARQPDFLERVRKRLIQEADAGDEKEEISIRSTFPLLLAQYGDYSGLESELQRWEQSGRKKTSDLLMMGLTITHDPRYIEPMKSMVADAEDSSDLARLLKWLEGVKGPEARQLRRDINRRMRTLED